MHDLVSAWRCQCGVRIKVMSKLNPDNLRENCTVECPRCGDKQTVQGQSVTLLSQETPEFLNSPHK